MSKLTASATSSLHKGSRSVSASALLEAPYNTTMLSAKDGRKRRMRSLSESNSSDGKVVVQRSQPTNADFSSSLDEESGLEELVPRIATNAFSLLAPSFEPIPEYSNNKSIKKGQRSISTPKIKLKPRPPRRSSASIRPREDGCRTMMPSSFKSPPPKIFIPFLPSRNRYSQYQKALHPPPLILQLPTHSPSTPTPTTTTTDGSRFRQVWSDPLPLQIQKKTKLTRLLSTSLSSPPQLIPSFDYGMSVATTWDAITPPPISIRPPAPLTTPPSLITSNTPLLMTSVEAIHKNSGGEIVAPAAMVAKPIARRYFITPSNRHNTNTTNTTNTNRTCDTFLSWDDDCTPRRVFPSSMSNNHNSDVGVASLSSSVESSAFSFSSAVPPSLLSTFSSAVPPSLLSTATIQRSTKIIRRPLSTDEDDRLRY